jgi:hypothetical protein
VKRPARQIVTVALALLGLALWIVVLHAKLAGRSQLIILPLAAILALIGPVNRRVEQYLLRCDAALAAHRVLVAVAIGAVTLLYLGLQVWQFYELQLPTVHDEHVYLIQAHMLAHGRLWHAPYPPGISKFFDTFYMILDRVYAPEYFPGTALLMVPAIWLGWPFWATPMIEASIAAALFFLFATEILGNPRPAPATAPPAHVRALLGFIMLLSLWYFRMMGLMPLSEAPFLIAELLLFLAWMRWRGSKGSGWALLIGVAAGFAAIVRPLDAFCFAVPVGVAMLIDLWRHRQPGMLARTAALAILGAAPFLALQVIQDVGITGKWYRFPENLDYATNYPAPIIGFYHADPSKMPHPASVARQQWLKWIVEEYYDKHDLLHPSAWFPIRVREILSDTIPKPLLVVLVPLGLLCLTDARRWVMLGALLIFSLAYMLYVFHLEHYQLAIAPVMIVLLLLGWQTLTDAWPGARRFIDTFLLLALLGISVRAVPLFDNTRRQFLGHVAEEYASNQFLAKLPRTPAVVLFRFDPKSSDFHNELIYNDQVAWPDDAPVVRASDLGSENWQLFDYYAQHQPDRVFYIYDRAGLYQGGRPLSPPLGTARELAAEHQNQSSRP